MEGQGPGSALDTASIFIDSGDGQTEETEESTGHRCYQLVCSSWSSALGQGRMAITSIVLLAKIISFIVSASRKSPQIKCATFIP